jgi:hypothetical protein
VGIGTTNPISKLQVNGQFRQLYSRAFIANPLDTDGYAGHIIVNSNNANGDLAGIGLYTNSSYSAAAGLFALQESSTAASMVFYTGSNFGAEKMRITSAGNVGIGTTSPSSLLHIVGSSPTLKVEGTSTNSAKVDLVGSFTTWSLENQYVNGATNDMFRLYNSQLAQNAITVDRNSNYVGLGTTSPAQRLDVNGNIAIKGANFAANDSTYTYIYKAQSNSVGVYIGGSADPSNYYDNDYHYFRSSGGTTTRGVWNANGLGIGTTSPAAKLHTVGSGIVNIVQSSDTVSYTQYYNTSTGNGSTSDGLTVGLNGIDAYVFSREAGNLILGTLDTERLRITSAGNVGIGTTSPAGRLSVEGDGTEYSNIVFKQSAAQEHLIYASANSQYNLIGSGAPIWIWGQQGSTERMRLNNTGLGIGTDAPTQKLHVSGNVRVTGAYYDSNNSAGSSGQVLSSTGSGTDWVSLSEITGVDGTGTANYVAKWSDTDTIANSQIQDDGTTVGIGQAPGPAKLSVLGAVLGGGKTTYTKTFTSLDTTGVAVAGSGVGANGRCLMFTFMCYGGDGYQRVVYSLANAGGVWTVRKSVDEGINAYDIVATTADSGASYTFTFKSRSGTQYYTPSVTIEAFAPYGFDTSYL